MTRLEKELGVELLRRRRYGVTTTPAGEVFMDRAQEILGIVADAELATTKAGGMDRAVIRVASFSTASINLVPTAMRSLQKEFSDVELSLVDMDDHEESCRLLLRGEVDIAIVHEYDYVPLVFPTGLVDNVLGYEPLDVVLPCSHLFAKRQTIELHELRDESWVLYLSNVVTTTSVQRAAADAGFVPRIACEVADSQVASALVASEAGITVLPRMVTAGLSRKTFAVRSLTPAIGRTVTVFTRPRSDDFTQRNFVIALTKAFKQIPQFS